MSTRGPAHAVRRATSASGMKGPVNTTSRAAFPAPAEWKAWTAASRTRQAHAAAAGAGDDQFLRLCQSQPAADPRPSIRRRSRCYEPGVDHRNPDLPQAAEGLAERRQLRVGVYQHRVEMAVERRHDPGLVLRWHPLLDQDVPHAADDPAGPAAFGNGLQHRVDLEPEGLAPERIQLDHEQLGPFDFKRHERRRAWRNRLTVSMSSPGAARSCLNSGSMPSSGRRSSRTWPGRLHLEPRPAGDQDHLVAGERPADLQAAEKVPHAEHVLAVEYDLHAAASGRESMSVLPMRRGSLAERAA